MHLQFETLNQQLTTLSDTPISLGLSGKMGYCIYFYIIGKNNDQYTRIADSILDSIINNIPYYKYSLDLKGGLPGIGLGINYLFKNQFVCGEINQSLKQFDDAIYKMLMFPRRKLNWFENALLLYYYNIRLKDQEINSDYEYIFKRVIFKILNELSFFQDDLFEEPYSFSMEYKLPIFLYVLSELSDMDYFRTKIKKMIDEITHKVVSLLPVLSSHKIYLTLGMLLMSKKNRFPLWEKHISLLRQEIRIEEMWNSEFRSKNVFFMNGLTGIFFLINQYNKLSSKEDQILLDHTFIMKKIEKSQVIELCLSNKIFFTENSGLFGFCSLSILNNYISSLK